MKWTSALARAPLPMLALAASYGVFEFQRLFVPVWVAFISAAAFEVTYVALAFVGTASRRRATAVSVAAVVVSVAYNTLAALFARRPALLVDTPLWGDVALASLHGLPLAVVAYNVAALLLHDAAHHAGPARTEAAPPAQDARTDAPVSAWACVKCGEPVASAAHRSASGKWGCEACKRRAA